jgi:hypothetical protein
MPSRINAAFVPFARRIDPAWSAEWVRRTLTDEPGKGMGSPFSDADALLFIQAYGLTQSPAPDGPRDPRELALLERMWEWIDAHRG